MSGENPESVGYPRRRDLRKLQHEQAEATGRTDQPGSSEESSHTAQRATESASAESKHDVGTGASLEESTVVEVTSQQDSVTEVARRGKGRSHSGLRWFGELAFILVAALVISTLVKTLLVQAFVIPSGSMEDTLQLQDRIMVSKLVPMVTDVKRGDVVVFLDPGDWLPPTVEETGWKKTLNDTLTFIGVRPQDAGHHLVKRVIGIGGDHVQCCDTQGRLQVNGISVDEPYLKPGSMPSEIYFDVTVPEGKLWVMGDNRANSEDSRAHQNAQDGGFVPVKNVVGRAFVIMWPWDRMMLINEPCNFAVVEKK